MPDLIISLTVQQAQAVGSAVGYIKRYLDQNGVPRAATVAEVRALLVQHLKTLVMEASLAQSRAAAAQTSENLNLT